MVSHSLGVPHLLCMLPLCDVPSGKVYARFYQMSKLSHCISSKRHTGVMKSFQFAQLETYFLSYLYKD